MKNSLWVIAMAALLVSGCSEGTKQVVGPTWDTKEEAIRQYINKERAEGSIVQLDLSDGKVFLLVEERNDFIFLAKL